MSSLCDSTGLAMAIFYWLDTVEDGDAADTSILWTPDSTGSYIVKVMIWDELSNPILLSENVRKDVFVTVG